MFQGLGPPDNKLISNKIPVKKEILYFIKSEHKKKVINLHCAFV